MSKATFYSILKSSSRSKMLDIDLCWNDALRADLPSHLLELLKPYLCYLPAVNDAYSLKYGEAPLKMTEEKATKLILESFIDGGRTSSELQKMFSIPSKMRTKILEKLIAKKIVVFQFCPISNRILYDLNSHILVPRSLHKNLRKSLSERKQVTLTEMYLRSAHESQTERSYSDLCMIAKRLMNSTTSNISVFYSHENVVFQLND